MKLLNFKDLETQKGIRESDVTIWRRVKAGQFPKPVRNGRRNYWVEAEIDEYLKGLIAQRQNG